MDRARIDRIVIRYFSRARVPISDNFPPPVINHMLQIARRRRPMPFGQLSFYRIHLPYIDTGLSRASYTHAWPGRAAERLRTKRVKNNLPHKSACVPRAHLAAREISPSSRTRRDGRVHIYENIYYIHRRATPNDSERARALCLSLYCPLPFCVCTCYR